MAPPPIIQWQLVGFNYDSVSLLATCFKDGAAVITVPDPGGMLNPTACGPGSKLLIGCQYDEVSGWYEGKMGRPRAWPRQLSADEWKIVLEMGRHWLGD